MSGDSPDHPVQPVPPPPLAAAPPTAPTGIPTPPPGPDGLAIASLILGIFSCLLCCHPLFTLLLGIPGFILGYNSKTKGNARSAGIMLSIIGPCIGLFAWLLLIAGCVALPFAGAAGAGP